MISAGCLGGCFLNHPKATIDYSGLRKGGKHSENSFLIRQFMIREDEGGKPTRADLLGLCSHHDKEQCERRNAAGDQSTTFSTSQRAALKRSG